MTLYHDDDEDAIIENHPDYAEFDDEGRLVLHMDELQREEKVKSLLNAAASVVEASDSYELVQAPSAEWSPEDLNE